MKKLIQLLQLVIVFILSFSSFTFSQDAIPSGTARYEALGFNPFIMDAAIDLNRNPGWGNKYNNYTFGDAGRFTPSGYLGSNSDKDSTYHLRDQYLAVNFRAGRQWSLGILLNKEEGRIFFSSMRAEYEALGNNKPLVPFKALIAYNASPTMTIGLAPYVAYWSSDVTAPNLSVERSTGIWGATFGLVANSSKTSWSEGTIGVRFNNYSVDSTVGTTNAKYENDGGLELNAFYRGWYRMKNTNVNLVPYVSFDMMNWEPTRTPALSSSTEKNDFWNIMGGVGINFPISSMGMLAAGVSGGYVSDSFTETDSIGTDGVGIVTRELKFEDIIFPKFNIGLEWNLLDWLQGRFGYSRSMGRGKVEFTQTDTTTVTQEFKETFASNPDETITLGVGMQFGSFSLDGLVGERFIQIGPNIFSGKENDLYGVVSLSYNFKK